MPVRGGFLLGLNVIWVFNPKSDKVLMCKRHKQPYLGLFNLVGGKIEKDEDGLAAAYRELQEETGITASQLTNELLHLMDFSYFSDKNHPLGVRVEVYAGRLATDTPIFGDEKELLWLDVNENFFDMSRFAGKGNIGHILEIIKHSRPNLL
jgi:8-oxo-dGTP diphosphatase